MGHLISAVVVFVFPPLRESALLIVVDEPAVLIAYKGSSEKSSFTNESKKEGEESFRVNRGDL